MYIRHVMGVTARRSLQPHMVEHRGYTCSSRERLYCVRVPKEFYSNP